MTNEIVTIEEFERLYRENYRKVRALVLRHGFRDGKADDIIQEAFVTAWEKRETLKEKRAFAKWLLTIARNQCLMNHRSAKSTVQVTGTDSAEDEETTHVVLEADDAFGSFQWEHSLTLLRDLIRAHESEPRASVARLFYLEERSVKDICAELALKQNTVLSHLRRFRLIVSEALLDLLDQEELVLP